MKKAFLLFTSVLFIMACKEQPKTISTEPQPAPAYPYTIENPDNWLIDTSHANTLTALNTLKAFESWDTVTLKKNLADTLTFKYDGGTFKGTPGQFIAMLKTSAAELKDVKIKVTDWETVVGKNDKKEEWVTVWYVQYWKNSKGKADSVEQVNDISFKGGKIVRIDEYNRHYTPQTK